jgi:uncharacterized protein YpmS
MITSVRLLKIFSAAFFFLFNTTYKTEDTLLWVTLFFILLALFFLFHFLEDILVTAKISSNKEQEAESIKSEKLDSRGK